MKDDNREEIMEKRSSLRGWRERGGKISHRSELIGAVLIGLIFLAFASSYLWNYSEGNNSPPADRQKTTQAITSPSAPSITIYSPENATYNTTVPPLNFIVAGNNLKSILLSVDDGPGVAVPHDGTMTNIDSARLNPLFIDNFAGKTEGKWKDSNAWIVEGGKYITTGGTSSFGGQEWDDYTVEARIKIAQGRDVSVDLRWDGGSNHYRVQTSDAYGSFALHKLDSKGYTTLSSTKLSGLDPSGWHTWKIEVKGNKIQAFVDDVLYIDRADDDRPYLNGSARLRTMGANVEYDHVYVYRPLSEGQHKLSIRANNTAGSVISQTVYFAVNSTSKAGDVIGKIGVPLIRNGLEVTVKSVTTGDIQTSAWLSVKNGGDAEKPLKLSPAPVILDNRGNQYENLKVTRSAEIAQTNLYPNATREGAVFFEKFKEGTSPEKLFLYVNGDKFEFMLD